MAHRPDPPLAAPPAPRRPRGPAGAAAAWRRPAAGGATARRRPADGAATLGRAGAATLATALVLTLAAALAGCGGSSSGTTSGPAAARRTTPRVTVPASVAPGDARAVRAWAATMRRGDVAGAARLFAPGAVAANGTTPAQLRSPAAVLAFNRSLPCGPQVTALEPSAHGFVIATFRLTERPGAGTCGKDAGQTAHVALRIRDRLIVDWIRLPDQPAAPATAA
jgi:hypothetical protein